MHPERVGDARLVPCQRAEPAPEPSHQWQRHPQTSLVHLVPGLGSVCCQPSILLDTIVTEQASYCPESGHSSAPARDTQSWLGSASAELTPPRRGSIIRPGTADPLASYSYSSF